MIPADDAKKTLCRNKLFRPVEGVVQHRALPDEIDVLLRQAVSPQLIDKGPEALALSAGQHDPAAGGISRGVIHGASPFLFPVTTVY
jgi:hypothetical protein